MQPFSFIMTPFIVTIKNRDLVLITQYTISAKDELAALYKLPSVFNRINEFI